MEHFSIIDNLTIRLGTTEDLKGGDTIIHCGASKEIWIDWKSDIIKHINSKLRLPNESLEETKSTDGLSRNSHRFASATQAFVPNAITSSEYQ